MNTPLYIKAEAFMVDAFTRAGDVSNISHHQRTVYWIKYLKPDANDALLLAGILHDIERAFNGDWKAGSDDPEKLKRHQELSANEAEKFLRKENADEELIAEVKRLILHHEDGGDADQDVLCDADCLAYFEQKAVDKAMQYRKDGKAGEYREKLDYLLNRLKSNKARSVALPWYVEAMKTLNNSSWWIEILGGFWNSQFLNTIVALLAVAVAGVAVGFANHYAHNQNDILKAQNSLLINQNTLLGTQADLQEQEYRSDNYPSVAIYEENQRIVLRNVGNAPFYFIPPVEIIQKCESIDEHGNIYKGNKFSTSISKITPVFSNQGIQLTQPINAESGQFCYGITFDVKNYQGFQYHVVYELNIEWKDGKIVGTLPNLIEIIEAFQKTVQ